MTGEHHPTRTRAVRRFAAVACAVVVATGGITMGLTLGFTAFTNTAFTNTSFRNTDHADPVAIAATVASPAQDDLGSAEALVRAKGYRPYADLGWGSPNALKVVLGTVSISVDGYSNRAFFFADGRYVGTDTPTDSAGIVALWSTGDTLALSYQLYNPEDPMCCPTANAATVRYRWTGGSLVPLDRVPSADWTAVPSRR
jgi:hypothetical protein